MSKRASRPIPRRDEELDSFKREVNLSQYAATLGYALDRKASGRSSAVMRHAGGDKIIVTRDEHDGHWVFCTVGGAPDDSGTIIDFIRRRKGGNLGEIRKELRPWVNGIPLPEYQRPAPEAFMAELRPVRRDLIAVRLAYEAMAPIDGRHDYLEQVRMIPVHVLTDPLFCDRIRVDEYKNAIFPHYNRDGLCGFEVKNKNHTRFATGGTRGLWFSGVDPHSPTARLVVAESAIDALSYVGVNGHRPGTRYLSTAGEFSADQAILIQQAIAKLPEIGGQLVLALDNDDGGTQIGAKIEAVFQAANRPGLDLAYDRPTVAKDWNDVLRGPAGAGHDGPSLRPRPPH